MKVGAVAVSFNFLHGGHLEHLEQANRRVDKLIVIVVGDESLKRQKGNHNYPLNVRLGLAKMVKWLNSNNEVVVAIDKDDTVAETLRMIHPDYFLKGGERTSGNMPKKEIDVCREIGCEIVYEIGGQLDHSSRIKKLILEGKG